jgi:hypothetical protein
MVQNLKIPAIMEKLLLSTAYFPNLSYCKLLLDYPEIVIDIGEHFVKQSHRSRCVILGPNKTLNLIVPLKRWMNNSPTKDIEISYNENWQKIHWKSLEASYRSSPYFEYYEDKLEAIVVQSKFKYLVDLNQASLDFIKSVLDLNSNISVDKEYIEDASNYHDLRNHPSLIVPDDIGMKSYIQVFSPHSKFEGNLSFIDLICNEGPNAIHLLP